jgi:hypothetical protein
LNIPAEIQTGINRKVCLYADDYDIISNRMLLAVKNEIAKPLSLLFNRLIQEMVFPDQWKIAHVIASFKKGDKSRNPDWNLYKSLFICR